MSDEWDWMAFNLLKQQVGGDVPVTDLCVHCQTRPATLNWYGDGGALAVVHGPGLRWCQHCAVTEQLAYAKKLAATIPDLERQLKQLP